MPAKILRYIFAIQAQSQLETHCSSPVFRRSHHVFCILVSSDRSTIFQCKFLRFIIDGYLSAVLLLIPGELEIRDRQQGDSPRLHNLVSSTLERHIILQSQNTLKLVISQYLSVFVVPQVKKGMQGIDCILYEKKGKGNDRAPDQTILCVNASFCVKYYLT